MADLNLPPALFAVTEFAPIEDILLGLLRGGLWGIPVYTLIPEKPVFPFVLVRKVSNSISQWDGDPRFVDRARFTVQAFTQDPDGDEAGAVLSEAIRVVLHQHWMAHTNVPGFGTIVKLEMVASPTRVTDWATSAGPVQYADLPTGTWRYEAQYVLTVKRARR